MSENRIGTGVDIHPIEAGRECWIAGLNWPGADGCAGHSDGDVVAHAACNALLSAAGLGDLGAIFGTDDPALAGASGARLLAEVVERVTAEGWRIENVAVALVAGSPRFAPRRAEAQEALAEIVGAPVMISASTTDGLGFIGRGEGRAATATALLARSPARS